MERWTSDGDARHSAPQHTAVDSVSGNAIDSSGAGIERVGTESPRGVPIAFRAEESRSGSAARVKRAVERLQRQPLHSQLQSQLMNLNDTFTDSHEGELSRLVELEIIPRLMLLHGAAPVDQRQRPTAPVLSLSDVHVEALARLAAEGDAGGASGYVRALMDAGASLEQVYLDLLGPAAKLLGTKWEEDSYDFSMVTIGLWRLQQVVYEQGRRLDSSWSPPSSGQRALLSATPGSKHTFGLAILAEFFTLAGWDVQHEVSVTWDGLRQMVGGEWFDMVGISVAKAADVLDLASAIASLRQISVNPRLLVMVGGPATSLVSDLAQVSGADLTASDAAGAVELANRWMGIEVLPT